MTIGDQVFPQAPVRQWVLSLYFRSHLLDFLVTRARTFRGQPPANYDPLHPPLVKLGFGVRTRRSKPEEETSGKLTTCRHFPTPLPIVAQESNQRARVKTVPAILVPPLRKSTRHDRHDHKSHDQFER